MVICTFRGSCFLAEGYINMRKVIRSSLLILNTLFEMRRVIFQNVNIPSTIKKKIGLSFGKVKESFLSPFLFDFNFFFLNSYFKI